MRVLVIFFLPYLLYLLCALYFVVDQLRNWMKLENVFGEKTESAYHKGVFFYLPSAFLKPYNSDISNKVWSMFSRFKRPRIQTSLKFLFNNMLVHWTYWHRWTLQINCHLKRKLAPVAVLTGCAILILQLSHLLPTATMFLSIFTKL